MQKADRIYIASGLTKAAAMDMGRSTPLNGWTVEPTRNGGDVVEEDPVWNLWINKKDRVTTSKELWESLGDVCTNEDDEIESQWLGFEIGTHRQEIWNWFEKTFDVAVAHLMGMADENGVAYPDPASIIKCNHCGSNLGRLESVTREYTNKDRDDSTGKDSVVAYGHYEKGEFESDIFKGFGGGNYDLHEDSDTCSACDGQL